MKILKIKGFLYILYSLISSQTFGQTPSTYQIDTIYSEYLNEDRVVSIYLPPNYDKKNLYPVIFATDGQILTERNYPKMLDSLIIYKQIPPLIVITSYCNDKPVMASNYRNITYRNITYRNLDYVYHIPAMKDKTNLTMRFVNHFAFFEKELISFAEKHFAISKNREDRIFYGVSNGGEFAIFLGTQHPNLFSCIFAYSPCGNLTKLKILKLENPPKFYIALGDQETFLIPSCEKVLKTFKQKKYPYKYELYQGGHDSKIWKNKFKMDLIHHFSDKIK